MPDDIRADILAREKAYVKFVIGGSEDFDYKQFDEFTKTAEFDAIRSDIERGFFGSGWAEPEGVFAI